MESLSGVVASVVKESASAPGLRRSRWARFKAGVVRRFGWVWQPLLYTGILLGLLMGRAVPISQVAPLGVAYYAAVRAAGFGGAGSLAVGLAVCLGALAGLPLAQVLWVALAVSVVHLGSFLLRAERGKPKPLGAAVLAVAASAIPAALLSPPPDALQIAFWAGLTGVLALVFTLGIIDVTEGRFLRVHSSELPVPAIVMVGAALTGLDGLVVQGVPLHGVAAGLMVMACAYAGGLALGAAAGAVLGISLLFTAIGVPPLPGAPALPETQAMAYVVAGFLAGSFRDLRKPGVGVAFFLAFVTYSMAALGQSAQVEVAALTALIAVALFWATPKSWLSRLPADLIAPLPGEAGEAQTPEATALGEVAHRIGGMARVMKEVQRTFEQVAAVDATEENVTTHLFDPAIERVCRPCSMYQECWERQFDRSYHLFTEAWMEIERAGFLPDGPVAANLEQLCINPGQIAATLTYQYEIDRSRRQFTRRLEEGRSIAGDYIKNVARLLDRMAEEVGQFAPGSSHGVIPIYRLTTAVTRLPKRGGHVSGDSYESAPLSDGRHLMALSDGMGVGQQAAQVSRQCVKLLNQLLDAGFAPEVAVRTVNSVFLLRSPDDSFATVDFSLCDLGTGRVEFVKVGAAPSFIKRGADVTVVKMHSVPIGIINQVQVEPEFRNLQPGDVIVMITDGIWDASKEQDDKERWILSHLAREQSTEPEEIAERLLARALELMPVPEDDMTVLVGRLEMVEVHRQEQAERPRRSRDWVPVQTAPRLKPHSAPRKGDRP